MAYSYDLLPEAKEELDHALEYYEEISSELRTQFLWEFIELIDRICEHPQQFPPHLNTYRKARFTKTFDKYHIVFKVYSDLILIVAVAHDARRENYWKDRT
jgi:plasmid stabilization system protein ParE